MSHHDEPITYANQYKPRKPIDLGELPLKVEQAGHPRRNPRFHDLLDEIRRLHDAKSHDYAADQDPLANLRACAAFGITPVMGVMVRLSDKWGRLQELLGKGKTAKNESIRDTFMDLAVYSLLAILLHDETAQGKAEDPRR